MKSLQKQSHFYYIVLKGRDGTSWLADERVKKQFLDSVHKLQTAIPFQIYAYCAANKEVHFLISLSDSIKNTSMVTIMSQNAQKCYQNIFPEGKERMKINYRSLKELDFHDLMEYCGKIHLISVGFADRIQDYWWSSYQDYLNKNYTGLVDTDVIMNHLDKEPRKAAQKFVLYHKKLCYTKENV